MTRRRKTDPPARGPARIEYVKIENFRALRSFELADLTPLTALVGPNGSGKSTVFDAFSFLAECFQRGLRSAWDERGRFAELRSRGSSGPIAFELRYTESPGQQPAKYRLVIDEGADGPLVVEETLERRRVAANKQGAPFKILSFKHGRGWVISGERPEPTDEKVREELASPETLAVSTLGRLAKNPHVVMLRSFIASWYVSHLTVTDVRRDSSAGPQERLNRSGDNLANVIQYLDERAPEQLEAILGRLRERVPALESISPERTVDGRVLLRLKDAAFANPTLARFASDGTLKLLAYLVVLHDRTPPPFIGIEEPENFLHPRLLLELAEECRAATERAQLLVTTHSPFFIDGLRAEEVRVLYRDMDGYTRAVRASDQPGVAEFMDAGALLGQLWFEGHLAVGDPLVRAGRPQPLARQGKPGR